ncbi:GIY-YIG nuclease family protein [uncultured Desulfovibrio sp.]|uniref:GIY-YIG nuclease family protein n=1 Tax=uncultured Desulfovibrio sp. TaxID=167968 RepID=UPI0025FC1943|nr:GIY-YIG nuclease family protein [uncultured Desulfovibrio sp.]
MNTPWHVYLLRCADDSLYCGITTDMARRLAQHNGLLPGGARYTRARRPVRLEACRTCADRSQALRLEARIKKIPRRQKSLFLRTASL